MARLELRAPFERIAEGADARVYAVELSGCEASTIPSRLVLRIFKREHRALLEAGVMDEVARRGFPAPRVPWASEDRALVGAPVMLVERISGRPMLGDPSNPPGSARERLVRVAADVRNLTRLGAVIAEQAAALHALDGEAVLRACGERSPDTGYLLLDAALARMESRVASQSEPGLTRAFEWVARQRPPDPKPRFVCHGDLNPTNILVEGSRVTGVIDWSAVSFDHREREIGVLRAGLMTIPILGFVGEWVGRWIAASLTRSYRSLAPLDEAIVRYYEAYIVLHLALQYRDVQSGLRPERGPWDNESGQRRAARHFEEITGVRLPF